MAIKETSRENVNGNAQRLGLNPENVLPGTTFPQSDSELGEPDQKPHAQPGPMINNKPTMVTLYQSKHLEAAGQIPGLHDLINVAFATSHNISGVMPSLSLRLASHKQLVQELSGKGTFTYVITYTGTDTCIGTASAKRYMNTLERTTPRKDQPRSCFRRTGTSGLDTEGWELASMAVDPTLQRKGLAGLLMGLVEGEVKRRFLEAQVVSGTPEREVIMLLTTVKEIHFEFYSRRGYGFDYETYHEPGWLGSLSGFTVVHMSKQIDT
ncbi:hypothetical protein Q7P37_004529 [Cladosporium fusiforme]